MLRLETKNPKREIRFRGGWGCLVLLAIILGPEIFQVVTAPSAQAQVQADILIRLKARYTQDVLNEYSTTIGQGEPNSPAAQEVGRRLAAINNVTITSFSLRTAGPGATARVQIQMSNGSPPPDGVSTRYFNIKQHLWGAWWMSSETRAGFYRWRPW